MYATFNEEKKKEITELLKECGRRHCSDIYPYKVEFIESGENMITQFSIIRPQDGKEILKIQNLMTPQGFQELENAKGWTVWAVEQAEVLKSCFVKESAKPKKISFLKKLFQKCERKILGYSCNFRGKCEDCKESAS